MISRELMLNDWVEVISNDHLKYVQIKEIYQNSILTEESEYESEEIRIDNIKPIPLTPEILEKNGFYWGYTSDEEDMMSIIGVSVEEKGWVWDEGAGSAKIIFPNESDGGIIILSDQNFDRDIKFYFVEIIYVHELQHALKLCGIEKTIEL